MKELWLHLLLFSLPPFGLPCFFTNVPVLLASARTAWLLAKLLEGKVKWKSLSHVQLFSTPWTIQSMRFFRPEYWSGLPCSSPGDLSSPRIKPRSPTLQADSLPMEPPGKPNGRGALLLIQSCKLGVSQVQVPYVRRWISQQDHHHVWMTDRSSILGNKITSSVSLSLILKWVKSLPKMV